MRMRLSGLMLLLAVLLGVATSPQVVGPRGSITAAETPAIAQDRIVATLKGYLSDWQPLADALVPLPNGGQAKSSNVYGVEVDGARYYYRLKFGFSADPLSRGVVAAHEVVAVLQPGTQWETEVYRFAKHR